MSTYLGAFAAAIITLLNHFLNGVTLHQQVVFYLPIVLAQCIITGLALYTVSVYYLRPVFTVLDALKIDGPIDCEIIGALLNKARRAAFNYPFDMLLFITATGVVLILTFHPSEYWFLYGGNIPANWWPITITAAIHELNLACCLGILFFVFSRNLMKGPLEITTGLAPDKGKRLSIKSRLLLTIITLVFISACTFMTFYFFFPLMGKPVPPGLFLAFVLAVTALCCIVGYFTSIDTGRDIIRVTKELDMLTRGVRPDRHQTLPVTSLDEVGDLVVSFNRLQQRMALYYREVDRELALARSVQAELLPKGFPTVPGWSIAGRMLIARQVGGDFYDYFSLPGGRLGLAVGDAAGKGMPAALLMSAVIGLLRAETMREVSPAKVLRNVNNLICGTTTGGMFITALYAVFDPGSGSCTLASAGHLSPVRFFADGTEPEFINMGSLPLGLERDVPYGEIILSIPPGGGIAFYSDGIVEARNADGVFWGFERLLAAFQSPVNTGIEEIISALIDEVLGFVDGMQEDDMTLMVIQRKAADLDKKFKQY